MMAGSDGIWWARGDLNPGPPPCEGGVLTRLDDGPCHETTRGPDRLLAFWLLALSVALFGLVSF